MKKQNVLPGIILIGFGLYFLLQQLEVHIFPGFYTWPTFLVIIGVALLGQAYSAKEYNNILPGVILFGFGLHFHMINLFSSWPDQIGMFVLIIAIGMLLRYQKTKVGLFQALFLLAVSGLVLFYNKVVSWLGLLESSASLIWRFWPAILLFAGVYLLFIKKK